MTWWKGSFDTKTSTWQSFGRLAFVEADDHATATDLAMASAKSQYPGAEITRMDVSISTEAAASAYFERVKRYEQWLENGRTGKPNPKGLL